MPRKLPKYAHWVAERRFLVDAGRLPARLGRARRIEDLYIEGGRLRLRRVTELSTGEQTFKLAKKYAPDNPLIGLPNVIHTPHLAASTSDAQIVVALEAAELVRDFLLKGEIQNVCNPAVLEKKSS